MKSAISTSIFLSTVRNNTFKKHFWRFHVEVKWKTSLPFLLWVWIFPMVNLFRESSVTRTTVNVSLQPHLLLKEMSSRSLCSGHAFLLSISFYTPSLLHICCWYTTQLSNVIQQDSYIHQHILRKRLQASSCFGTRLGTQVRDFSACFGYFTNWDRNYCELSRDHFEFFRKYFDYFGVAQIK